MSRWTYCLPPKAWYLCSIRCSLRLCCRPVSLFFAVCSALFSQLVSPRFSCPNADAPVWCGHARDSEGKLILASDGTVTSKCVAEQLASQCPRVPNVAAKPSSSSHKVPPNSPAVISAASSDNTPIASLAIPSDAASGVTFSVAPVPDSVYQAGSFSALFSSGKLRSPLVSISPDAIVDTRGGGVALSVAVDVPADSCIVETSNMKVAISMSWKPSSSFVHYH